MSMSILENEYRNTNKIDIVMDICILGYYKIEFLVVDVLSSPLTLLMAETSSIPKSDQATHGYRHDKIKNRQPLHKIRERALPGLASAGKQRARLLLEAHPRVQGSDRSQKASHERVQAPLQRVLPRSHVGFHSVQPSGEAAHSPAPPWPSSSAMQRQGETRSKTM